jgi:hypothetical protein
MSALPLGEGGLELDKGFFVWLHPTELGRALFAVDDVVERAMGEATSWSCEGLRATLSKLVTPQAPQKLKMSLTSLPSCPSIKLGNKKSNIKVKRGSDNKNKL